MKKSLEGKDVDRRIEQTMESILQKNDSREQEEEFLENDIIRDKL